MDLVVEDLVSVPPETGIALEAVDFHRSTRYAEVALAPELLVARHLATA